MRQRDAAQQALHEAFGVWGSGHAIALGVRLQGWRRAPACLSTPASRACCCGVGSSVWGLGRVWGEGVRVSSVGFGVLGTCCCR